MKYEYHHKVIVAENDRQTRKIIDLILKKEKIECIFATSGESALKKIKNAEKTFALIIADQETGDMTGAELLEQTRQCSPDSIHFLMAESSDTKTIINAVNKGSIQRYIIKPCEEKDLAKAIKSGIKLYELFLDNKKLVILAKKQNLKLYDLNCELMETTKTHNQILHDLDTDIAAIKKEIKKISSQTPLSPAILKDEIQKSKDTQSLFSDTIKELYNQFNEIAQRSGFEMPEVKGEIK